MLIDSYVIYSIERVHKYSFREGAKVASHVNIVHIPNSFNKRDVQVSTFGLDYETQVILTPKVPTSFTSWANAGNSLETILPNILYLIRLYRPEWESNRYPNLALPDNIDVQLEELKDILQRWLYTFQKFLVLRASMGSSIPAGIPIIREQVVRHTLMIQYWTAFIWVHTPFSSTQTVHDAYLAQFTEIADLAEAILTLRPDRSLQYSSENDLIHPLFYVAQKCRDGNLRRRAMALLRVSGREGVWDGRCVAAAASWIIEKEEEDLRDGIIGSVVRGTEGFVEEEFRLRESMITFNRLAKSLTLWATKINEKGEEYWICGNASWGEGESENAIVYGESDKLWQKGLLFG